MKYSSCMSAIFLFILAYSDSQSFAGDFYKWVDEKGQVHYSDNKAGAKPGAKGVQKRDFSEIEMNVTPPVEWPPSVFSDRESKKYRKSGKGKSAKHKAGNLPWFTTSNFGYEVLRSGRLTLVEFWAVWCGVCRKVDPTINGLAREYAGKIKIGRVDIDEESGLSKKYKVRGVPNLIFFKNGKVVGKLVGGYSKDSYVKMIERYL